MIVASLDWKHFLKFDPSTFLASTGGGGNSANREVIMSSNSPTPVDIEVINRVSSTEDPLFGAASSYNDSKATKQLLYREDS